MAAEFRLTRENAAGRPDVAVIQLAGWLDRDSEQQLVDAVQQAKDAGAQYAVIDMRDVATITSSGIRALQRAYQIITPKDAASKVPHLKLCHAPAQVYQVLSITGLLVNVPMYESAQDAIDSFGK